MKVYNSVITNPYQHKPSFSSNDNEWHVFGIDEGGQATRDYIRQWRDEHYIPYQSIYEKGYKLSEFELKQVISDLVKKPVKVNNKLIDELHLQNLDFVDNTSYRGAMIKSDELGKVEKLYEAGIRRIIPVGRGNTDLKNECEKIGMEYQAIEFDSQYNSAFKTMDEIKTNSKEFARDVLGYDEKGIVEYVNACIGLWKENSRSYIDEFTSYIQKMKKGNVYIGCEFGRYDTDVAVMFDYLFNPTKRYSRTVPHEMYVRCAENLYHNLTDSDKLKMGWTKDFEKTFFERLRNLKSRIRR